MDFFLPHLFSDFTSCNATVSILAKRQLSGLFRVFDHRLLSVGSIDGRLKEMIVVLHTTDMNSIKNSIKNCIKAIFT
jgi:hypothetical protein